MWRQGQWVLDWKQITHKCRLHAIEVLVSYNKEVTCRSKYLDDKMAKSPPSISRILQKSTPLTKGTAVSSSNVKCTWNLNFFFFIKKDIVLLLECAHGMINANKWKKKKINKNSVLGFKVGAENPSFLHSRLIISEELFRPGIEKIPLLKLYKMNSVSFATAC